MQPIPTLLQDLDRLYRSYSLAEYEQTLQTVEQQVQQLYPGFTIAYAEIATAGAEREPHGGMRHVLLPLHEKNR
jgi:hypothetical protein